MFFFACSGPFAMGVIRRNAFFSLSQAAVLGLLCYASLHLWRRSGRRHSGFPVICLALLVLHPTWVDGGIHGDCGYGMVRMAIAYNVVALLAVVLQGALLVRSRRMKPKGRGNDFDIDA